jgi:hypothetical protein
MIDAEALLTSNLLDRSRKLKSFFEMYFFLKSAEADPVGQPGLTGLTQESWVSPAPRILNKAPG